MSIMNKFISAAMLISIVFAFSSCSDEDEAYSDIDMYVTDRGELSKVACKGKYNKGLVVYIESSKEKVVCTNGYWRDYEISISRNNAMGAFSRISRDTVKIFDLLPVCTSARDSSIVYVKSMDENLVCLNRNWVELSIAVLGTRVYDEDDLPECYADINGAVIYLSSLSSDMICSDGEWVDYSTWYIESSSSRKSSSSSEPRSSSSSRARSSSSQISARDWTFGACDESREGEIVYDTNYVVNSRNDNNPSPYSYYECINGIWSNASLSRLDTLGWGNAEEGTLKAANYSVAGTAYRNLDDACPFKGDGSEYYYVFEDSWRLATLMEVCFARGCTSKREGEVMKLGEIEYVCETSQWKISLN